MIELRPEGEVNGQVHLDELVGRDCTVHLERLDERCYMLIVEDGERRVHVTLGTADKFRRKVNAKVYEDGPAVSADVTPKEEA